MPPVDHLIPLLCDEPPVPPGGSIASADRGRSGENLVALQRVADAWSFPSEYDPNAQVGRRPQRWAAGAIPRSVTVRECR